MKTRTFYSVIKIDEEHVVVKTKTDYGTIDVKRTFRKHSKEIRELMKQGVYCFEIQGILYWYEFDETNIGVEYAKPEDFRTSERTTNRIKGVNKTNSGIKDNSVKLKFPSIKTEQVSNIKVKTGEEEVKHNKHNDIKTCIKNDIPVYLTGEAGSGKNFTLEQISWELGLEFYFTNSVQQEYKLTGFIDAGGTFHETEFYKAFKNGGMFFLDEMDASIPEVLVLLNAAIANKYFEFPNGKITAHKNFRVVAAGNTVGSGSDELYTGRLVLDQATLDRFVIIEFGYDKNIELHISENNTELVEFIRTLRNDSKINGIRATFSYRCISMVTKLEKSGMDLKNIFLIAVFKGMERDTINCFQTCKMNNSKYRDTLEELQRVA